MLKSLICITYICLRSKKTGKFYINSTSNLKQRFYQHNQAKNFATKADIPWELVYYEAFPAKALALQRESKLKQIWQRLG